MRVLTEAGGTRDLRRGLRGSVGLVPTMGALHDGHLSLVRRARAENDAVAASIFVNPTQFGPGEDLAAYPRSLAGDLARLEAEGVDLVFTPDAAAVYPPGFQTWVVPGPLAEPLEGARRPGHFRGVLTVVSKLLHVVEPDRAYFGQKDAQQAILVRRMVADLDLPVGIVVCPIVREPDGLALSSRNAYLTSEERRAAPVLYRSLRAVSGAWDAGERRGDRLREAARAVLAAEPLAAPDYVSAADPETLAEIETATGRVLVSMAVRFGTTRLLDNILLPEGSGL
ncbi:MAG TPA: pantoate--beta-alanine ligase [Thermoanaerobaculia bacterium]|nr:pantoate--beta-alanine ligase [Thermoanaerobaculia bacterium]